MRVRILKNLKKKDKIILFKLPKKKIVKKFQYPLKLIEQLILDIDCYKDFLPWCNNSNITSKKDTSDSLEIIANLDIGYSFAKDTYTSEVKYNKKTNTIVVKSINGPLNKLENIWILKEIENNQCEVSFSIDLELKNFLLNKMLITMFDLGFDKILKSFEDRAKYLSKLN